MAKTCVLDRVAADLAHGRTHPAMQRLGSLIAAHPTDLDLRHRLAMLHRRVGNRIQAGRWDYLTADASSRDTSAFERAFPSALARLREIHWPHQASAASEHARTRLAALFRAAEAERKERRTATPAARRFPTSWSSVWQRAADWSRPFHHVRSWSSDRPRRAVAVGVVTAATAALAALGVETVLRWIL